MIVQPRKVAVPTTTKCPAINRRKYFSLANALLTCALFLNVTHATLSRDLVERPPKILMLGGSMTHGSKVEDGETFASVIEHFFGYEVHNLATDGTGAEYTATCLQTMVESLTEEENIIFDVITVEFSINGTGHLDALLKRLRLRYPDALIIYVDLYAPTESDRKFKCLKAVESGKNETCNGLPECLKAVQNGKNEYCESPDVSSVDEVGGVIYTLPSILDKNITGTMDWFTSDGKQLSKAGHFNVAAGIVDVFQSEWQQIPDEPELGSWFGGDQCLSFFNGKIPSQVEIKKGKLTCFDQTEKLYAIERNQQLKIQLALNFEDYTEVTLVHMIKGVPSLYPKVRIVLWQKEKPSDQAGEHLILERTLQPMEIAQVHVRRWYKFGRIIPPGEYTLTFTELEEKSLPFRITGLVICSVCAVIDDAFSTYSTPN